MPAVSPTLTPAHPEPLPPTTNSGSATEELAFFDRVKKHIANKQTFNEFLKLCNLFSQDLIEKNILVEKMSSFIGEKTELMTWFKNFVGYEGKDEMIENRPRSNGRVSLSNCRALGPSYRLLPNRVCKSCLAFDPEVLVSHQLDNLCVPVSRNFHLLIKISIGTTQAM
jgi:paired amphipathic helix protein Sin3a